MEIQGYPNYLIYRDGRVQNKQTKRFLKLRVDGDGYKMVDLYKDGKRKTCTVHRLVGIHYIPNPEGKGEVDHIDRDKLNNDVSNLRWATSSENNQNKGTRCDNTSGHKNICWDSTHCRWRYLKEIRGKKKQRYFKSKTDAICYKFGMMLMNNL